MRRFLAIKKAVAKSSLIPQSPRNDHQRFPIADRRKFNSRPSPNVPLCENTLFINQFDSTRIGLRLAIGIVPVSLVDLRKRAGQRIQEKFAQIIRGSIVGSSASQMRLGISAGVDAHVQKTKPTETSVIEFVEAR